jgi:hypothetical protein
MVSIGRIGGQPTMSGGHYYLNDHGDFIPVTRAAYWHALVLQQRIFTLGPGVFFALGVLVHWPWRRTRPGDDPLEAGPLPRVRCNGQATMRRRGVRRSTEDWPKLRSRRETAHCS